MSDAPANLERIEQGGTHDLDITFLTRAKELGGVAVNPDSYDATSPAGTVTAEVKVYNALASDPDDPANWSTPDGGLNPPTIGTLLDGGSTGRVLARYAVESDTKLSAALLTDDDLRWGIRWATTINGVSVEFFEFVDIVAVGSGDFGDGLFVSVADVRAASAFTKERDIDNDAVEALIRRAQREFLHDLAVHRSVRVLDVKNAARTTFEIDEWDGYLVPDAYAELEDATTYTAQFLDSDDVLTSVGISSKDVARNRVTLATAAATDETAVLSGWFSKTRNPDPDLAAECVTVLATHYMDLRAQEPGSIRLADPSGGRALATDRDTRFLDEYHRLLKRFSRQDRGTIMAGQGEGAIGRRRGILG